MKPVRGIETIIQIARIIFFITFPINETRSRDWNVWMNIKIAAILQLSN